MVFIYIKENDKLIILDCHKGSKEGDYFQLVIDVNTKRVVKRPYICDIDVSVAYSHIYSLLKNGKALPKETVAAWG